MAAKMIRTPPQNPPVFFAAPETITNEATKLLTHYKNALRAIAASVDPNTATFENLILPIAHVENDFLSKLYLTQFYQYVSPDPALREAGREASKILLKGASVQNYLWEHVKTVCELEPNPDPEKKRFLEVEMLKYIQDGLNLPAGQSRDRIKKIKNRLDEICVGFEANLINENGTVWLREADLAGVPAYIVNELDQGVEEHAGEFGAKFKSGAYGGVLGLAISPDVRKQLYLRGENMCNDNVDFFKESIVLRSELAILLGYPDFGTFAMEGTLIREPDTARRLLARFQDRVSRINVLDSLKEMKRNDNMAADAPFWLWDESYYKPRWLRENHSFSQKRIADYFPLQPAISGMLGIFEELFDIAFEKYDGEAWHEDVEILAVWDGKESESGFLGYLYLDLYLRPGKYDGAATFKLQPSFENRNGDRTYAACALVCSFHKPMSETGLYLLEHRQVVTAFHELGHNIHVLLSKTKYARFNGYANTSDFIEVPSMMLEHWCWSPALRRLSGHYQTGEPIPDDLLDIIIDSRNVNRGVLNMFQVFLASFDVEIHSVKSVDEAKALNVAETYNKMRREIMGMQGPEVLGEGYDWGHAYATRKHQISDYPGTLYTYISSFCFSELMWNSLFENCPMNKEAGMRYRRIVLEKGGSENPMDMLEKLLGKRPSVEALCSGD